MALQIIHLVMGKANPQRMNGVNKVVHYLAEAQANGGADVEVWGITKTIAHTYPERSFATRLFLDQGKWTLDTDLISAIRALDASQVHVHIHGGFIPQFFLAARQLKKAGVKYTYTPHGAFNTVAMQRSAWKKRIYTQLFEQQIVSGAKHVHLIGASEVVGTQQVFGNVPHVLIPNGQALGNMLSNNRNEIPVFGFIGRLDMHTKGLDILLPAFARFIESKGVSAVLRLVGGGPDEEVLKQMAQDLGIEKQIEFMGPLFGIEKDQALASFDFLCLTSRNEGLPGVVLEAAELGVPAIVSEETNMGAYLQQYEAGYVLEKNDAVPLSHTLESALCSLQNDTYERMSNAARKMIASSFSWRHIARTHLNAYSNA